ncbi:hypothetical protein MGG_09425 [Pyricularia oryzae 70-15]|uniref:Uncharacterized protein n=1 Tax=Pyricularia oryzae (strain 70-15 / ATCC MYA-4617 / FGSC 8958) TaxID=242507 RepID=G4NHV3_PYRO7|nr:uncharacterized protein MGG_09425 [Pyricularia oryzae 70-15]EHA47813.1 hypothetical protein MGG_09425 [Pyricularia oryzae 70-15]KAI7908548.1 hypothetical protein M9X92_012131 [Pyricularia oryzae]
MRIQTVCTVIIAPLALVPNVYASAVPTNPPDVPTNSPDVPTKPPGRISNTAAGFVNFFKKKASSSTPPPAECEYTVYRNQETDARRRKHSQEGTYSFSHHGKAAKNSKQNIFGVKVRFDRECRPHYSSKNQIAVIPGIHNDDVIQVDWERFDLHMR